MEVTRLSADDLPATTVNWLNRTTLLGSIPFARLWDTAGGRVVYWAMIDGDRVMALLPGVEFGRGLTRRYQSMPDGLYSRILFPHGSGGETDAANVLPSAVARAGHLKTILNDYYRDCRAESLYRRFVDRTMLVNVSGPDWEPPDAKIRSEVRKATREGVKYLDFSLNRHFDPFMTLMKHTERRHDRRPKYSREFYRELARLAMIDNRVRWLVVEDGNELAASHIYLLENDQLIYWQAFLDKRFSHLKANQFMLYTLTTEVSRRGVTTLNLGATPPEAQSLTEYKAKWGGETYEYPRWERRSLLGRLV